MTLSTAYVADLAKVIDIAAIRGAKNQSSAWIPHSAAPASHYWVPIAERYGLNLTVVNEEVDPTFRFMPVDWDGQIRMDPSSPCTMQRVIDIKDRWSSRFGLRHGS